MSEPNVNIWKEAIEKLEREEKAEAKRLLRERLAREAAEEEKRRQEQLAKERHEAEKKARFEAAVLELEQFLRDEAGVYAEKLMGKKHVFLVLHCDRRVYADGVYWATYAFNAGGLFYHNFSYSRWPKPPEVGFFISNGKVDNRFQVHATPREVATAMARTIPAGRILNFICESIDELARQVLEG